MFKTAGSLRPDAKVHNRMKTGFEHEYEHQVELSRLALQWHVTNPDDAILFYPLRAINGQDNDSDKVIFFIDLHSRCLQVRIACKCFLLAVAVWSRHQCGAMIFSQFISKEKTIQ